MTLKTLAATGDVSERLGVVWNPNTPEETLFRLSYDKFPPIAAQARERLGQRFT